MKYTIRESSESLISVGISISLCLKATVIIVHRCVQSIALGCADKGMNMHLYLILQSSIDTRTDMRPFIHITVPHYINANTNGPFIGKGKKT